MPFEVNEAPDMILKAIHSARVRRGCGTFWSIVCCIPTFGMSTNCCGSCNKDCCEPACCYPGELDEQTIGSLRTLEEILLRDIRIDDIKQYRKDNPNSTVEATVESQVIETMRLVKDKLEKEFTTPSDYKNAIQIALRRIEIRARSEASAADILERDSRDGERRPLLRYPLENLNPRTGGFTGADRDPNLSKVLNAGNGVRQPASKGGRRDHTTASAPATPQAAASSSSPAASPQPSPTAPKL